MSAVATLAPLSAAALVTAAGMYPVDVMRALKMSSAGSSEKFSLAAHYKAHGVRGFVSQGVLPELLKSTSMRVSKFFFFPIVCEGLFNKPPPKASGLEKGLAGALATVPEILLISPMEVAKIGLQLDRENKFKNNSTAFARHIYETKGISGLYSGWAGMQWRQSWWTGTYFATLSWWKKTVEPPLKNAGLNQTMASIISGFLAGMFASIPNTPGDVVRSVVQKQMFQDPNRKGHGVSPAGVWEHIQVSRDIVRARGVQGLWAGFVFKSAHLGGSGSLMSVLVPYFSDLMGIPYSGV